MSSRWYLAGRLAALKTAGLADPPSSGWFMTPTSKTSPEIRRTSIDNAFSYNSGLNETSSMSDPAGVNVSPTEAVSGRYLGPPTASP